MSEHPSSFGRNARIGRAIELAIYSLLVSGNWAPTAREILICAGEYAAPIAGKMPQRLSDRQRIAAGVLSYFRYAAPASSWILVGRSTRAAGVEFDLLWRRPDERLVADELKSGRLLRPLFISELREQTSRQLAAGRAEFGDAFAGVRLIWLANPEHSFFAPANGGRDALTEAQSR